ncbi:MAG: bifunctional 5,10-methylene-tetrahydrofolate dehydrogenase/5,10-methylene-tetrahydrofolate cyclohydrolase, partial [Geobacteraceae bacterium]
MHILDGKKCAESLIADIAKKVAGYVESGLRKPHMTIIHVGE